MKNNSLRSLRLCVQSVKSFIFPLQKKQVMKVLLDIKDSKADFIMQLLKSFSFVKAEPLSPYKSKVFKSLKESINEMKLIESGKLKSISGKDLLNEL